MTINLSTSNAKLVLTSAIPVLTSGMKNAVYCEFTFDADWNGLDKVAVFRAGPKSIAVHEANWTTENKLPIPWEVLTEPNQTLYIGVCGESNDVTVIPTIWCRIADIRRGTDADAPEGREPTPTVWAHLEDEIANANNNIDDLDEKVNAKQDALTAGANITIENNVISASGTLDHRQLTNRDAAKQHPISAITGLQTALDGLLPMSAGADHPITGDLYLAVGSSKRIRRLGTPQTEYDAANKEYVDNAVGDVSDSVSAIEGKIPTQATSTNQLADKNFVNSSIENVAAYFITKDAAGNPFATKAELNAATVFYSGGQVRVPTRNDYTVVLADESKTISATGENPTTRYIYDNNVWSFQYIVNNSGLTAAQWAAVNSGITAEVLAGLASKTYAEQAADQALADAKTYTNNHHDSTKQDALTAGANITIENNVISTVGGSGVQEVFFAVYGSTSLADIITAHQSGKEVLCIKDNKQYQFGGFSSNMTSALFYSYIAALARLVCDTDGWRQLSDLSFLTAVPQATGAALGGIKAAARDASTDTQEVKIDTVSGKLYVPDAATKEYVDTAIGDIETALSGI